MENMSAAMAAVAEGQKVNAAALSHDVPRSTLRRRLSGQCELRPMLGSRKPVFSVAQESELQEHILKLESMFFGLTPRDVRTLAFQYAELNGIPHNFPSGMAGKDWLRGFLQRPLAPEATSAARASGFNKPAVDAFF